MATAQRTVRSHSPLAALFGPDNDAPGPARWDSHGMTQQPAADHNAWPAASRATPPPGAPEAASQGARCPACGAALAPESVSPSGGTPERLAQAIDNLYREVARLSEVAERTEAAARAGRGQQQALQRPPPEQEALREEIRQLRATVARLRGTTRVTGT